MPPDFLLRERRLASCEVTVWDTGQAAARETTSPGGPNAAAFFPRLLSTARSDPDADGRPRLRTVPLLARKYGQGPVGPKCPLWTSPGDSAQRGAGCARMGRRRATEQPPLRGSPAPSRPVPKH